MSLSRLTVLALLLAAIGGAAVAGAQEDAVKKATAADGMYAVFETTMGPVVCQLHYDKVPVTVANFVGLATGGMSWKDPKTGQQVTRPFYDGTKFHRIIKDFMAQGGCPLGNGRGGPGYSFFDEIHPDLHHDGPGVLSMANSGPATNGSQFFITHVATPWLDGKHTVFGKTVLGQDLVNGMAAVPMKGETPATDIVVEHVRIVRTGAAAEAFDWKATWDGRAEVEKRLREEQEKATMTELASLCTKLGVDAAKATKTASGLKYCVKTKGTGAAPKSGQNIKAHYTGYLPDGTKFDSSVDRGTPFETAIGVGRVIKGWDEAFLDMKVGEKRVLIIPPDLGYGARATGPIPANATLVFDVELLAVN
jgi:peptidylprolyl isomerase